MSDPIIYKYDLTSLDNTLDLPSGSAVLDIGYQARLNEDGSAENVLCLWALVEADGPTVQRRFILVPTGETPPSGASHVRTVVDNQHGLVWHIFEPNEAVEENS